MAVNQVSLAALLAEIQAIGVQMNQLLNVRVLNYAAFVVSLGAGGLQAAPFNMTPTDSTVLFNACQDLDNFRKVYSGLMYVTFGATLNSGTPTNNDGTHFGYPFNINVNKCTGFGY